MDHLTFAPQWADVAAEKPRFTGVAYSGGLIPSFGKHGDSAIDLADFTEAQVMLLGGHGNQLVDIVGTGRLWRNDQHELLAEGEVTRATESGRIVAQLLAEGVQVPLSVGITAEVETGRKGRAVVVNNRDLKAKTVFRSPLFREVSFVPVGADPHAHAAKMAALEAEMANQEEWELQIEDLKAKLAAAEDRAVKAEAKAVEFEKLLKDIQFRARKHAVEELHATLNKPCTETAMAMFQSLTDEQFGLIRDSMLSLKVEPAKETKDVAPMKADALLAAAAQQQPAETASLSNIFALAYKKGAM